MTETRFGLPRPGVVGIGLRLAVGALVGYMALGVVVDAPSFWDGYTRPLGSITVLVPLVWFSPWVLNELVQKDWGWRPAFVMLAGLGLVMAGGALNGDPFGPAYGIYIWVWAILFSFLLGPALLLAALLRTPGCEMRSYMHLWTSLRGGDPAAVACPGWIDRFDRVRVFGRW